MPLGSPYRRASGETVTRWNVGGFTQLLSVPAYMVFHLPDGVGLEESCIVGCRVTTAYNAVKNGAHLAPGESAMVIGCGGVGLNIIQMLRLFGAYPIVAVDVVGSKLEAALSYGASHIVNATADDPVEATKEITKGGARKTFEAIGNPVTARPDRAGDAPHRARPPSWARCRRAPSPSTTRASRSRRSR